MEGKGIPIPKRTARVSLLPVFCGSKQGRRRFNKPPHMNTKISLGICRTAETFPFSLPEHPQSATQQLSQGSTSQTLLGERTWKERRLETKHRTKLSQTLHSNQHWSCCILWIFNHTILVASTTVFTESGLGPASKGSPLPKFKLMKWIQDWPLNHTYSSAKEKHVDAKEPFRNRYIHHICSLGKYVQFSRSTFTEGN